MSRMFRAAVAWASARLASTFRARAAAGLAVQESGKRFAAQWTTTSGVMESRSEVMAVGLVRFSDTTSGGLMRLRPVPMAFHPARANWSWTWRPRRPLAWWGG